MRTRKALLTALICAALLATACSGKPGTGTGAEPETAEPETAEPVNQTVTLKILAYRSPALDTQLHDFYAAYPNIRVESVVPPLEALTTPSGGFTYKKQALAAGDVDLALINPELLNADYLMDLTPWVQKTGFDLKPIGDLDGLKTQGKLYQLPWTVDPKVLVYNQDLFQAAGVPAPSEDWTWDDFRATAKKVTRTTGDQQTWGFDAEEPEGMIGIYAVDGTEEHFRAALQFFSTMTFTDQSMPPQPKDPTATHPRRFAAGQAAMTFTSLSTVSQTAGSVHWDTAPMPHVAGQAATSMVLSQSLGMGAHTKHPAEAWELLQFLTGEKGGVTLAAQGLLPAYRSQAVQDAWFHRLPTPGPGTATIFKTQWSFPKAGSFPTDEAAIKQLGDLSVKMTVSLRLALSEPGRWERDLADYVQIHNEYMAIAKPQN